MLCLAPSRRRQPTLAAFAICLSLLGGAQAARADLLTDAAGSYKIEPSSSIRFHVDQVGGGGIDGSFGSYAGAFTIDGSNIGRSSVTITIYPDSVRTDDARITDFLRSNAVFDVADYPQITFRSTAVTRTGDNAARIDGLLTARGKTNKARFDATFGKRSGRKISFRVTGSIHRAPYGMDVGVPVYSNVVQFDMTLNGTRR